MKLVMHRKRWLILTVGLLALSVASVWARAHGYPEVVPGALAHLLDQFVEPGVAVWWFTIGGVFQSFPSTTAGYSVAVLGNTALWLAMIGLLVLVTRVVRRILLWAQH